ncbi:hypothetical protein HIM_10671 [Hirsutella minnesotensis 3608]|uniref:EKC/KEOPS complex subunit BUD32 n=1 Tax=Hirsutella minnesotensis 3608 TaxID=1043627 RepID=A0A0F7ZRN7_9HYPO|nr:hypothetical protein HIM_10671 [Hirsutella minnesotensis 3608]
MFSIAKHFLTSAWAILRRYMISQCAFIWNLLPGILTGNVEKPSLIMEAKKQPQQQQQRRSKTACTEGPRQITYVPIPGPWRREEKPNWPDSAFQIPAEVPDGTIYYITKGRYIGQESTAHIELLPSGHIVKYPKSNPYYPKEEEDNRERIRSEAAVYERLKNTPCVPRLVDWDSESCCLTLEHMEKGSLEAYVRELAEAKHGDVPAQVRRRWAVQAARAVEALHAAMIIHCDVTPRNFLLNAHLDLHIADFAGCSISGSPSLIAPGARYQPPRWSWKRKAMQEDDVFALGSVLYFIMVGTEPYADLEEETVHDLFQRSKFPKVDGLACGEIIQGCWDGTLSTAVRVVDALNSLDWEANTKQSC